MAKKWFEVEQSQLYQDLSPQDKINAKKQYFNDIVANREDFQSLTPENQKKAETQFFGGELVENIPEEQFQPKNLALETAKGTIGTIAQSAGKAVEPFTKPVETAKGLIDTASDVAMSPFDPKAYGIDINTPMSGAQERTFKRAEAIGKDYAEAYGSREKLAKTVAEDPVRFILDVSLVGGLAKHGLKQAGTVSKSAELLKAAETPTLTRAGEKIGQLTTKAGEIVKSKLPQKAQIVDNLIKNSINKAIRPSVAGKKTASQLEKYNKRANEAVKTIVENKESLQFTDEIGTVTNKLPESLQEFADAIQQTKSKVYNLYDDLIKETGENVPIELNNIADEVRKISNNKTIAIKEPSIIKYTDDLANRLEDVGSLGVREADELIKSYNESLKSFYENPTYESATRASIDSMIANRLRKALDEKITSLTGSEFQTLKNKYGALAEIEKDVLHRAVVDARKNTKGLLDFTDIFSAGDVIAGIGSANPSLIAKGFFQNAIKNTYAKMNNPNTIVKNMFKNVDRLHKPRTEPLKAELVLDMPISRQQAISGRAYQYGLPKPKTQALPSPKTVGREKYVPTGERAQVVPRKFRMGDETIQKPIEMPDKTWNQLLKEEQLRSAEEIKKKLAEFNKSEYVKGIKKEASKLKKEERFPYGNRVLSIEEEARKYKSAKEFVDSKDVVYHQSQSKTPITKMKEGMPKPSYSESQEGIYFSPNKEAVQQKYGKDGGFIVEANINPKKTLDLGEYDSMYFDGTKINSADIIVENLKRSMRGEKELLEPDIQLTKITKKAKKWLQKNGYDSVEGMKGEMWFAPEIVVLDPKIIKTKTQLKEIWNKANAQKSKYK